MTYILHVMWRPTHRIPIVPALFLFLAVAVRAEPFHLTIGAEPDYPPFSFLDEEGLPTGFSIELFQAVADAMGLDVTIETDYWESLREALAGGEIDALPLVARTPEREEVFDFTVPYLSRHGGIVVRRGDERIGDLDDLKDMRVAVMAADSAEEFLRRHRPEFEIATFPTFMDALRDVTAGKSDAVVIQRLVAIRLLQQDEFEDLRLLEDPVAEYHQDFGFAVTRGNSRLLALLNEGLALVITDGTYRRLHTRWFTPLELPSRTILVGGDYNYPPFEYLDEEGNPAGYNVDLVRAVARAMDLDIEIRLGPWTRITDMLAQGEIDLIQGMMYSPERDRIFDFSQAHTVHHHIAIGRGGRRSDFPVTPEELRGHSIAVQAGDIMHDYVLSEGVTENLTVVDSQEEALRLVVSGAVDYALGSQLTALYLIQKNGWDELVLGRQAIVPREYGFAVRRGNQELLSLFSGGLAVVRESGEYRRIREEWLGVYTPSEYDAGRILRIVLLALLPVLLILTVVILWNRSLRAQVVRKTVELRRSMQRTRWLNEIATSYLLRKDTTALIEETLETLNAHFSPATSVYVTPDADSPVSSLFSDPVLVETLHSEGMVIVEDVRTDGRTASVADKLAGGAVLALAAAALPAKDGPGSVLAFTAPEPRRWRDAERLVLKEHADLLSIILENAAYERKMADTNRELAVSLEEKKTLLKEIHHRVKNNLNVIVSLLRLQEDQIESVQNAREAFEHSRNRIHSMALVHESLYRSENLADIELDAYIRTLLEQLKESYGPHQDIRYICDLESLRMDIVRAVPCGIIINELVTNARKHAFRDRSGGTVTVSLRARDGEFLLLSVRDDGPGFPAQLAPDATATLGLTLVTILSRQIGGTLEFSSRGGARVDLTLPLKA